MAIEKMKMVSVVGVLEHLDDAIEAYLDSECFHAETASKFVAGVKGFSNMNEENPYGKYLVQMEEMFEAIGVTPRVIKGTGKTDDIAVLDEKMNAIKTEIGELIARQKECERQIDERKVAVDELSHFAELDVDLDDAFSSEFVRFRFGRLPLESEERLKFYENNPYVTFYRCSEQDGYVWGMYAVPKSKASEVDSIFGSLFFERMRLPSFEGTPKNAAETYAAEIAALEEQKSVLKHALDECTKKSLDDYLVLYSQIKRSYDAAEIRKYATRYGKSFMLIGWIPLGEVEHFEQIMSRVEGIEISYTDPDKNSSLTPPTRLKNFKLFRPFEYYTEMFGVPCYNEIDPTPILAITYTLLYGIMFADVGQGLILALVGFFMFKLKKMPLGKIIIPCGICGAFFGLIFGSVFGFEDLLDPLYKAVGLDGPPIRVMSSITTILIGAVLIGAAMMILAMCLNIASRIKQRDIGMALVGENGLCGLLLYLSVIVGAGGFLISDLAFLITPAIIVVCVAALIIMFKEPLACLINRKKFVKEAGVAEYIMQSFFELFEALLSYITNTVSFLRVGAFVLVHNGMMMVFFTLANMIGGGVGYWIVIVLGNVLVLVLEGLLVGIQSLRLEFYEMFSRYYSGEGKAYAPALVGENNQ